MEGTGRRAVAAGFSRGLDVLTGALGAVGYRLAGRAPDGSGALRLMRGVQPDLVVCDAILPGMDGVAFARQARRLKLNAQPAILLLKPRGLRLPGEADLAKLGALAVEAPLTAEGLARALDALASLPVELPPEKAARLEALLDALGIPAHPGRECLRSAVALAWADRRRLSALKRGLYPQAARCAGLRPDQAERAIRHVIDAAWRTGQIEQQHQIFGDTIDARRGRPTGGEMIAQLAEELRWEG